MGLFFFFLLDALIKGFVPTGLQVVGAAIVVPALLKGADCHLPSVRTSRLFFLPLVRELNASRTAGFDEQIHELWHSIGPRPVTLQFT